MSPTVHEKERSERLRILLGFASLGVVGLMLVGRLAVLQGSRSTQALRRVARQSERLEEQPAPRGTIVDREGRLLAYDRPVVEVRAELRFEGSQQATTPPAAAVADVSVALAAALEPAQETSRRRQQERLAARIEHSRADDQRSQQLSEARPGRPARYRHTVDFMVSPGLEAANVIARLRQVDTQRKDLDLHFLQRHERTYPDHDVTVGAVGFVGDQRLPNGDNASVYRGMEAFAGLQPGFGGWRKFFQDARARPYWSPQRQRPAPANVLQCTLDLELQRAAHAELQAAVDAVQAKYGSPPNWATLCLVDIASGDLLAAASFRAGVPAKVAAFAPAQYLYPPGSVVKPLVFSLALERGALDWDRAQIDCTPTAGNAWRVPGSGRKIHDEHPCGVLNPHDVIVRSSNIGAAQVGLMLGREGLAEYLVRYAWGKATATGLHDELDGYMAHTCRDGLRSLPERTFLGYTAPSLSIGYDYNITPLQLTRAYLTLLSGRQRELRLFSRVVVEGQVQELPPTDLGSQRFLSELTVARLRGAMADVVSDAENATGRPLFDVLQKLGIGSGAIGGKTGTSEYQEARGAGATRRNVTVRSASFVGFAPVEQPRYLTVCVLQKDHAAAFWGGHYAAPAAGRLLLRALAPVETSPTVQGRQVSTDIPGRIDAGVGARVANR